MSMGHEIYKNVGQLHKRLEEAEKTIELMKKYFCQLAQDHCVVCYKRTTDFEELNLIVENRLCKFCLEKRAGK